MKVYEMFVKAEPFVQYKGSMAVTYYPKAQTINYEIDMRCVEDTRTDALVICPFKFTIMRHIDAKERDDTYSPMEIRCGMRKLFNFADIFPRILSALDIRVPFGQLGAVYSREDLTVAHYYDVTGRNVWITLNGYTPNDLSEYQNLSIA